MSGTEQFFFLVVVPAAIVAVVWALASIGGPRTQQRYRPGRPYEFATVWYVANHRRGGDAGAQQPEPPAGERAAVTAGGPAGGAGTGQAGQRRPGDRTVSRGTTGGASDRW